MDKLNLPIIKEPVPDGEALSMDEYFEFVNFNLEWTVDRKTNRDWKKMLFVNVPFRLNN